MSDTTNTTGSGVVGHLRGRLLAYLSVRTLLVLVAAAALLVIALVIADAVLILPDGVRAATPVALFIAAVGVIAVSIGAMLALSPTRIARRFESTDPSLGSKLTNAVQLAEGDSDTEVGRHLRRRAVEMGRERARALPVWPIVRGGVRASALAVLAAAAMWGAGLLAFSEVFDAVLPRLYDPHGDHPPYSRVKIAVEPSADRVIYGGQLEVRAVATGAPVEKLFVIAESASGERSENVMFRRGDGDYFQTLTNLREPAKLYVTDGRARSHRHAVDILYTPEIELVEVTTDYPVYTALPSRTRKLTESELKLPAGSRMTVKVRSNRPLSVGSVKLTPLLGGEPRTVELARAGDDDRAVAGSFEIEEAVAFEIGVKDVDALDSSERRRGRITIDPDKGPRISVLEPGRHAVATPTIAIPVHLQAEDDYAVERVIWFRGLNRSIERPVTMTELAHTGRGKVSARGSFDLRDLGVRPGDKIEYFFEAVDNYPAGPNVATSRIYTLEIISEEQYREALRAMHAQKALFEQYLKLDQMLKRLAERASTLRQKNERLAEKGEGATEADRQALKEEAERLAKDMEAFQRLAEQAKSSPQMFDIERAFKQEVAAQQAAMAAAQAKLAEMMKSSASPFDKEQMQKLEEMLGGMAEEMDQNLGEPARQIAEVARLMALADRFTQLALQQREIARLSKRFEDKPGPLSRLEQAELQELAAAERRVRDGLAQLLKDIEAQAAALPQHEDFDPLREQVREFLDAVAEAKIPADLSGAAEKLTALDGPAGHPLAQAAWEKMEALLEKSGGQAMGQAASQCMKFSPKLSQAMGSTLQQIMQAMQGRGRDNGSGGDGYSMIQSDVGIYGPDLELAGEQRGGSGDEPTDAPASAARPAASGDPSRDPDRDAPTTAAAVRLQREAKFPLRYRDLVGEYFRSVAESADDLHTSPAP